MFERERVIVIGDGDGVGEVGLMLVGGGVLWLRLVDDVECVESL